MARTTNPILGKYNQSAGALTFCTWKGKQIVKSKRGPSTKPPTESQLAQQQVFAYSSALAKLISSIINIGLRRAAVGVTERNLFMTLNKEQLAVDGYNGTLASPLNYIIAKGNNPLYELTLGTPLTASSVRVHYNLNLDYPDALSNYKIYFFVVRESDFSIVSQHKTDNLADAEANFELTSNALFENGQIICHFTVRNGTMEVSNCQFLGITGIA